MTTSLTYTRITCFFARKTKKIGSIACSWIEMFDEAVLTLIQHVRAPAAALPCLRVLESRWSASQAMCDVKTFAFLLHISLYLSFYSFSGLSSAMSKRICKSVGIRFLKKIETFFLTKISRASSAMPYYATPTLAPPSSNRRCKLLIFLTHDTLCCSSQEKRLVFCLKHFLASNIIETSRCHLSWNRLHSISNRNHRQCRFSASCYFVVFLLTLNSSVLQPIVL